MQDFLLPVRQLECTGLYRTYDFSGKTDNDEENNFLKDSLVSMLIVLHVNQLFMQYVQENNPVNLTHIRNITNR